MWSIHYGRQMSSFTACVAVVVVCCFSGMSAMSRRPKEAKEVLLNDVLTGLSLAVEFLLSDYQKLNIDGVISVRFCQDSLLGSLTDCASPVHHCPEELKLQISAISEQLAVVHEKTVPIIQKGDKANYKNFHGLLEAAFNVKYISEQFENSAKETGTFMDYDGSVGDMCFRSLMGTYNDTTRLFPKCTISDECWRFMTRRATIEYYTTHQLLYTIFGQHMGCDQELERRVLMDRNSSLRGYQRHLCQQIYLDAVSQVHNGTVRLMQQDLFMEQIGFCGILGFNTILKDDWIPMILSWQEASGCYAVQSSPGVTDPPAQTTTDDMHWQSRDGNGLVKGAIIRHKRNEAYMRDRCLSHKTGVAIIAMGAYARHLVTQLHADHLLFM